MREKATCDLCYHYCESIEKVNDHKLQAHKSGPDVLCMYCDFKTLNWPKLKSHLDANHSEHGEKKHFCKLCGKDFIYEDSCLDHMKTVHPNGKIEGGVCDICFKEFKSKYPDLNNHMTKAHTKDDYKLCMYNCEFKTEDWKELKIHIDEMHSDHGKKQHFCQVCQKGFIFEDSLLYVYRVKEYHKKTWQLQNYVRDLVPTTAFRGQTKMGLESADGWAGLALVSCM